MFGFRKSFEGVLALFPQRLAERGPFHHAASF
jgi:hypothetical protein